MPKQEQSPDAVPHKDRQPRAPDPARQDDRGDGPGKVGLASDNQPVAGGTVNLDDDDMVHPRGKVPGAGGTADSSGGDSAPLGPPGAGLSDRNGPSDPDNKKP